MIITIIGTIFIIVAGTLFHFVYEWSHHNKLIDDFPKKPIKKLH